MRCKICNAKDDLFLACTNEGICSICKLKYVGGDSSNERIKQIRLRLGLKDGEFLNQDLAKEAAIILGRN